VPDQLSAGKRSGANGYARIDEALRQYPRSVDAMLQQTTILPTNLDMDILIRRATVEDCSIVLHIGRIAVELSHRDSCAAEDMNQYLQNNYSDAAILNELSDPANIYQVIFYQGKPAGFSKIVLNASHTNIAEPNATKLDRIYLLSEFFDQKLGYHLLQKNIELSKKNDQCGMWLFTWTGNERAVNFYQRNGFTIIGDHLFKVSDTRYNPNHHMFLRYR
jgi:diamine N-acetyltransferase